MKMINFERYGHRYCMAEDDCITMLIRLNRPIHPVGRSFDECGIKSDRE